MTGEQAAAAVQRVRELAERWNVPGSMAHWCGQEVLRALEGGVSAPAPSGPEQWIVDLANEPVRGYDGPEL